MTTASFDPRALRDAFGSFMTGVTVVTANDTSGRPIGFTANSFASVSIDPPLLLVCLAKTSRNFATMTMAKGFGVNVLSEKQMTVSNTFAKPVEDRFAAVEWKNGPHGAPILAGVSAWFDCSTNEIVDAGDHAILIGRVEAFENGAMAGLGFARGSYITPGLSSKAVSAAAEGVPLIAAVVERDGAVLLISEADGRCRLPQMELKGGEPLAALQDYLTDATGLAVEVGFLYSVYDNKATGHQHIVYRAVAEPGDTKAGRFAPIADLPLDAMDNSATADLLRRFAAESALGNFGVYVGDEKQGKVHPYARKA
ncbi:flavin reductase family protein [Sinorhizobium americanum]|uniref:Flavin reductase (DIM6/NTAB) family NADH-FMN oxidoreductase RutF n=1 Tax=Sinorhizobium americanum TaxID=194963 RepID=A0A4R2BYL1_9HYPH|nr:flavin reductase family protein [Sinorhizobium americanum]TCN33088.1 flavin reductase (DIM6/NTAB) family NADH-FMN oxidoreductase RutF [Sinorhizobium americanum]